MKILHYFKKLIQSADLFATNEFLRYKSQESFQSLFGGIASVFAFVLVASIFFNRFLECINKVNISSVQTRVFETEPKFIDLSTTPKGRFMAAIHVQGINLANPEVMFFVTAIEIAYQSNGEDTERTYDRLQPCTPKHWEENPELFQNFKTLNMSQMMCLPLNLTIPIGGKTGSLNQASIIVSLAKNRNCPQDPSQLPRCPTDDQKRRYFGNEIQRKLQFYFTNYQVSPGKQKYITCFLDDSIFAYFTETIGQVSMVELADFTVNTDQSIFYSQEPLVETGPVVTQQPISYKYEIYSRYVQIVYTKSEIATTYERSFEKIYDVFSMAGGLFGIICVIFFIIPIFNASAYSINLGSELFKPDKNEQKDLFENYGISSFFTQGLYGFLTKLGFSQKWGSAMEYDRCEKEVARTVDILFLLQKIKFLQNAVSVILQDHQIRGLHLRQKMNVSQAKKQRQLIDFRKQFDEEDFKKLQNLKEIELKQKDFAKIEFFVNDNPSVLPSNGLELQNKNLLVKRVDSRPPEQDRKQQRAETVFEKKAERHDKKQETLLDIVKKNQQGNKRGQRASQIIMSILVPIKHHGQKPKEGDSILVKDNSNQKGPLHKTKDIENQIELTEAQIQKKIANSKKEHNLNDSIVNHKISVHKMMNYLGGFIKDVDVFSATAFLRFGSNKEYKTFFGGVVSILALAALLILFYNKFVSCINRQAIYASEQKVFSTDPSYMQMQTTPGQNFMAYIVLNKVNLTKSGVRYFDASFNKKVSILNESTGVWHESVTKFSLESCTLDHWMGMDNILTHMQQLDMSTFLCLPKGVTFELQGKKGSPEFRSAQIFVEKCKNETDPTRPCDQAFLDDYLTNQPATNFVLAISNVVVNPQNNDYLTYFLYERAQFFLSMDLLNKVDIFYQDFKIITDESIFPWSQQHVESGGRFNDAPVINSVETAGNQKGYASINLYKTFQSKSYHRWFMKMEDVFSFIGGIFGIVSGVLFIVNSYNKLAYQVHLGFKLFAPSQSTKAYNFFYFLKQSVYDLLSTLGCQINWQDSAKYGECQQEMQKQLDIMYIIKRIKFLECSVSTILEDHEVKGLYLADKPTLEQVKVQRTIFKLKKKILKMKKSLKEDGIAENETSGQGLKTGGVTLSPNDEIKESQIIKQSDETLKAEQTTAKKTKYESTSLKVLPLEQESEPYLSDQSEDSVNEIEEQEKAQILQDIKRLEKQGDEGCRMSTQIKEGISVNVLTKLLQRGNNPGRNLRNIGTMQSSDEKLKGFEVN